MDLPVDALSGLAAVGCGSAPLAPETQAEFEARFGIPIFIAYGATEFCGVVAGWSLEDHKAFSVAKRGSVGRVRSGIKLRIVDPDEGKALAEGDVGVIEVQADRVGPDFVRTTDLGLIDADGFLFLQGRADDVINRGGFKIHPQKIEELLSGHAAIAEAAVVAKKDVRLGDVPVAVLVRRPNVTTPSDAELDAFLRANLRPQEVPAHYVWMDSLPRTPSMKIRRVELRALLNAA
jgi:acyl-CoA synthetase (AMP-forming)/AMP-acid ligase II